MVSDLINLSKSQAVQAISASEQETTILCAPGIVNELIDKGQAVQAIVLIANLPPERQTDVLTAPDTVARLANSGQAHAVASLLSKLTPKQQAAVLAVPGAKQGLSDT
jgi:hypothetical protein